MKTIISYISHLGIILAICSTVILGCRCGTSSPTPNSLIGFHVSDLQNLNANKAITDDYKRYILTLSHDEQGSIAYVEYFSDGTGQHAVVITISLGHTDWAHVLIYDKDNKRIKTIKYISGHTRS